MKVGLIKKNTFNLNIYDSLLKENKLVTLKNTTLSHADVLTRLKV